MSINDMVNRELDRMMALGVDGAADHLIAEIAECSNPRARSRHWTGITIKIRAAALVRLARAEIVRREVVYLREDGAAETWRNV